MRAGVGRWRAQGWATQAGAVGLVVAMCAAVSYSTQVGAPATTAMVVGGSLVLAHIAVTFPRAASTLLVGVLFVPLYPTAGGIYFLDTSLYVDLMAATATATLTGLVTVIVAYRTSRRRPWLTTLIALSLFCVAGPLLVAVIPIRLGVLLGWALVAGTVVARSRWLTQQVRARRRLRAYRAAPPAPAWEVPPSLVGVVAEELKARYGDQAVAATRTTGVFLVAVEGGTILVAIAPWAGPVKQKQRGGVSHRGVGLGDELDAFLRGCYHPTIAAAGLDAERIRAVVVAPDAVLPTRGNLTVEVAAEPLPGADVGHKPAEPLPSPVDLCVLVSSPNFLFFERRSQEPTRATRRKLHSLT